MSGIWRLIEAQIFQWRPMEGKINIFSRLLTTCNESHGKTKQQSDKTTRQSLVCNNVQRLLLISKGREKHWSQLGAISNSTRHPLWHNKEFFWPMEAYLHDILTKNKNPSMHCIFHNNVYCVIVLFILFY